MPKSPSQNLFFNGNSRYIVPLPRRSPRFTTPCDDRRDAYQVGLRSIEQEDDSSECIPVRGEDFSIRQSIPNYDSPGVFNQIAFTGPEQIRA